VSDLGWLFNRGTLTFLAGGLGVTLELTAISIALSFIAGVLLALARLSRFRPLSVAATIYIEGMRALPVLLVIFFAYFALPRVIGIKLEPFTAGVIAMSVFTAALIAEIVRAGIVAVPKGLIEAAQSQGLTGAQVLRIVALPIALRQMMPALVAQYVTLLKDTSLTAVIGILELTRRGQIVFAQPPFQPIPVFALIALIYFTANFGLAQIGRRLETRAMA
jgi:putative glutamine transport system permease protein